MLLWPCVPDNSKINGRRHRKIVLIPHSYPAHFTSTQATAQHLCLYMRDIISHVLLFISFAGDLTGFPTLQSDLGRLNDQNAASSEKETFCCVSRIPPERPVHVQEFQRCKALPCRPYWLLKTSEARQGEKAQSAFIAGANRWGCWSSHSSASAASLPPIPLLNLSFLA